MNADIDAKNMSCLYDTNDSLANILEKYYTTDYVFRYNKFIDCYGNIDILKERAEYFTKYKRDLVDHKILIDFAKKAAEIIQSKYNLTNEDSSIEIVTDEESKALSNAFISYIQTKAEDENE